MSAHPTDRLSEYLDGELGNAEAAAIDAHLQACAECRTLLTELREVVESAQTLEDRAPAHDLWPAIEAGLRTARGGATEPPKPTRTLSLDAFRRVAGRRVTLTVPQLAAAAMTLLVVATGVAWLTRSAPAGGIDSPGVAAAADTAGEPASSPAGASGSVRPVSAAFRGEAGAGYDAAVAELQSILDEQGGALAPATVAVLEENLEIIDRAIQDAYAALEEDPADPYLNRHLDRVRTQKLELLRRAVDVVRAAS